MAKNKETLLFDEPVKFDNNKEGRKKFYETYTDKASRDIWENEFFSQDPDKYKAAYSVGLFEGVSILLGEYTNEGGAYYYNGWLSYNQTRDLKEASENLINDLCEEFEVERTA